mgnify:CR=1 FL=1
MFLFSYIFLIYKGLRGNGNGGEEKKIKSRYQDSSSRLMLFDRSATFIIKTKAVMITCIVSIPRIECFNHLLQLNSTRKFVLL